MQQPDKRVRRDLVIGGLGDEDEGAAALRVTCGKLEEYHRGVTMPDQVDLLQSQRIENASQFLRSFLKADEAPSLLPASIEDDAARPAQRNHLPGINKFEVFEDGHEDDGRAIANVYDGQVE